MTTQDLPILGMDDAGALILGGFFTAHDTYGMHCDWFMAMFLEAGFRVSIPYFASECWHHPDKDPGMIWPMLESAYREARMPFDTDEHSNSLNYYMAKRFTALGKPSMRDLSLAVMREHELNGVTYQSWRKSVSDVLNESSCNRRRK